MYTHAAARPRGFGAASPFLLNQSILKSLVIDPRVTQCAQAKGTWDASAQVCNAGGGIPMWGYALGIAALGGAAWYFLLR